MRSSDRSQLALCQGRSSGCYDDEGSPLGPACASRMFLSCVLINSSFRRLSSSSLTNSRRQRFMAFFSGWHAQRNETILPDAHSANALINSAHDLRPSSRILYSIPSSALRVSLMLSGSTFKKASRDVVVNGEGFAFGSGVLSRGMESPLCQV
eukprot:Amastigsp_a677089_100.p1 type:complete len:153 gc:universal Amastigsp_a677089_100:473-15(-)